MSLVCGVLVISCGGESNTTTGFTSNNVPHGGIEASTSSDATSSSLPTTTSDGGAGLSAGTTTTDTETSGGAEDTTTDAEPKPAVCGDGVVDPGEDCDDGNDVPDDACNHLCALPSCGDGVVQMSEQCDAGQDNGPGEACLGSCQSNVCGDGDVGPGEGCDDGNTDDGDTCTAECALASCGDGLLNQGEACDDGNPVNTDSCTNKCTEPACGDGFVQAPEQCDNGTDNSDAGGCTSMCKTAVCGDGLVAAGFEQCDAGADNGPGQACLETCTLNVCGDGDQGPAEECDLGPQNGDMSACHANCKLDVCGDKLVGAGEDCDDGNKVNGDGCSQFCVQELWCGNKLYKCGNGLDDDKDGEIDTKDPECTSPCDDDEKSYQTSLPGQNLDCKSDCYWDDDSGVGNDHCEWNLKCDVKNPGEDIGCGYSAGEKMCTPALPDTCLDTCVPMIPNGCDCFGCCNIAGKSYYLDSNPQCSLDNLAACNECTFFPQCANPCDPKGCEICFGQDVDDLPPECNDKPSCPNNVQSCVDNGDCAGGQFCQTGCCVEIVAQ